MKSVLALSTLGLAALLSVTVACDNGGSAFECTTDDDCASADNPVAENTVCDADTSVCVAPSDPVCENDTDCDLQDTGAGSPIADTADFANGCEAEDYVTIVGFDGNEYCALEDSADFSCADDLDGDEVAVDAEKKAGGTVSVCVLADGTCSEDGQCE